MRALFLLSLLACGHACAQDSIYRGVDAHGRVVYSDSSQGVKNAKKIELAPAPISTAPAVGSAPAPTPAAPAAPTPKPDARRQMIWEAERALRDAQRQKEQGEEPEAGERLGTASGASRLAPGYFERQARLAKAVDDARAALERAQNR